MGIPGFTAELGLNLRSLAKQARFSERLGRPAEVVPAYWDIYPCYSRADGGVEYCCCIWREPWGWA